MGHRQSETLVTSDFTVDEDGNPTGGLVEMYVSGIDPDSPVLFIQFQDGIVGDDGQNGVFVEDVIEAALQRLRFFNDSKFRCRENSLAITKLEEALQWLDWRTRQRDIQGVENSYKQHD